MLELTLALIGFWLIVLVFHYEIRKREVEIHLETHRLRHVEARERREEFERSLEEEAARTEEEAAVADPTPSEIAAMVTGPTNTPMLAAAPDPIVEDVQTIASEQPDIAAGAVRRFIQQDPRPKRTLW